MITVLNPGTFTTVQDLGRTGFLRYGVPESGALDKYSLRCANLLLGNDEGMAGLEATLFGPSLKFNREVKISICGGDLGPMLDGDPINNWEVVNVPANSELSFQGLIQGARAYIAFEGGISEQSISVILGSMSTYCQGGFGGFKGRALVQGDTFEINDSFHESHLSQKKIDPIEFPEKVELRILMGPQEDMFLGDAIKLLAESEFKVTVDADRMGIRCEGPVLQHSGPADLISDGTVFGAIQVPSSGMPIILLADRGTTGGYPKIATVISADHTKLAQLIPGDTIVFQPVSLETAIDEFAKQENRITELKGFDGGYSKISVGDDLISIVDEDDKPILLDNIDKTVKINAKSGDEDIEVDVTFQSRK